MAYPTLGDLLSALIGAQVVLPIPTFGLLVAIAVMVSTVVFANDVARRRPDARPIAYDLATYGTLAGIVGARVFSVLEHPDVFLAHPAAQIFTRSGFNFYGGLVFGTVVDVAIVLRRRLPLGLMLDAIAPALLLAYGLGRIGCQISGDGDWGIAADPALRPAWLPEWFWAQRYQNNIAGVDIPAPGVYPTPLYELAMSLAGFFVLRALRDHRHRPGWLFACYLVIASLERLAIESIRVNDRLSVFGIVATQAQFIAVLLLFAGLIGIALRWPRSRPVNDPAAAA